MTDIFSFLFRRNTLRFFSIFLLPFIAAFFLLPGSATAEPAPAAGAVGDFLDQIATAGYPGAYGELLDHFAQLAEKAGVDAATKQIYDDLDKYNKWVSRISGVIDIGGKVYSEDYTEAAISASLLGISEYAGSASGKALLAAVGLSTATVTAATTAFQIWRASVAELEKQQTGVKLESLYGSIEADPVLKPRAAQSGRKLGEGDPIPVTPASVEHLWRKVLQNEGWRGLFRTYYTEELQQAWPEPSWWEGVWIGSATDAGTYEQSKLIESKAEIKQALAGLLGYLNRLAKIEEHKTLSRQSMAELAKMNQGNLKLTLQRYADALKRLPEVEVFAKDCGSMTAKAIKTKNMNLLDRIVAGALTNAAILQDIPEKGTHASKRASLLAAIRNCKNAAYAELQSLSGGPDTITVRIEEAQGAITKEITITNVNSTAKSYMNTEASLNIQEYERMVYEQAWSGTDAFMGLEQMDRRLWAIRAFDGGAWDAVPGELKNAAWPDSEYINMPKLVFPEWNSSSRYDYLYEIADYISGVMYKIRQHDNSRWLATISLIMTRAERIVSVEKEMDMIKKDLAAIRRFLADKPLSTDSGKSLFYYIDRFTPAVEAYYKALPETKEQLVFFQRLSDRIRISRERISDDLAYLSALGGSFRRAGSIIADLQNRKTSMRYNLGNGKTVLINPEMHVRDGMTLEDYNKEGFVMSRKDADAFLAAIIDKLKQARIFDIASKYSIKLDAYIDAQFEFVKNAYFPEHYFWIQSVYFYLIAAEDMDAVISGIEKVNASDDNFFDAIGRTYYPAGFTFHIWKQEGDTVSLDFAYLNDLSRGARDIVIRRKASAMVAVLSKKLAEYNAYLKKKQRYAVLVGEYSELDGRFSNLEYNAVHLLDGQDIKLWESVISMEDEIGAFFGKVSADPDLIRGQKDVMMKWLDKMNYRLFYAKEMLRNLKNRVSVPKAPPVPEIPESAALDKIREFYQAFKGAYESRNDVQLMSFVGDEWQAGDGTTLSDLEEHLRNSFTVFDDIRFNLSNLTIHRIAPNRYAVNYDIVITGKIFENNITREEKTTVDEEVSVDYATGKIRISRTLNGRFWYMQ